MKRLTFILLITVYAWNSYAQNLVPNWSFEDTVQCPTLSTDINLAVGWINPTISSPDYYNTCNPAPMAYQQPRTGNAYAGLFLFEISPNTREYIQIKLIDSLKAGHKYCVSFFVSRHDFYELSCNNIGAYFSNNPVSNSTFNYWPVTPQVDNSSANSLEDTVGWTEIVGSFIAVGGEQYLTIGNFHNDANSDTMTAGSIPNPGSGASAYYLLDDVSVFECSDSIFIPNVFTPNGDGINDLFKIEAAGASFLECTIYNRWGIKIAEVNSSTGYVWDGRTTSGIDAVQGVYYYIMNAKGIDGQEHLQKGFVHLLR